MARTATQTATSRPLVAWIALGVTLVAAFAFLDLTRIVEKLGPGDFIAYWSAGRLLSEGANPYDWRALLTLQEPLGWAEDFPNMMYYPPWALPLVLPFGTMPFVAARLLWLALNAALVLICADWIWRFYGGATSHRAVAWLVSLIFVPTLIALQMGQIGAVLLLGIIGFLNSERRRSDWLSGAFLLLPAVKPQLVYLFGLAVLIWAIDRRRWAVLLGGILSLLTGVAVALAFDPQVLMQYRYAFTYPPSQNITPTLGAILRLIFGEERTWLQYVPCAAGVVWFAYYYSRHRRAWHWSAQAPVLILVSFLTTAYGAWVFDLVVLLLPILQIGATAMANRDPRTIRLAVACFLGIDAVALAMNLAEVTYPAFIWMTPTILVAYLLLRRPCAATV